MRVDAPAEAGVYVGAPCGADPGTIQDVSLS